MPERQPKIPTLVPEQMVQTDTDVREVIDWAIATESTTALSEQHAVQHALNTRFMNMTNDIGALLEPKKPTKKSLEKEPRRYIQAAIPTVSFSEQQPSEFTIGSSFLTLAGEDGSIEILFAGNQVEGLYRMTNPPICQSYEIENFHAYATDQHIASGSLKIDRLQGALQLGSTHVPIESITTEAEIATNSDQSITLAYTTSSVLSGSLLPDFHDYTHMVLTALPGDEIAPVSKDVYATIDQTRQFKRSPFAEALGAHQSILPGMNVEQSDIPDVLFEGASCSFAGDNTISYGWALLDSRENGKIHLQIREDPYSQRLMMGFPMGLKDNREIHVWRSIPDILLNGIPDDIASGT